MPHAISDFAYPEEMNESHKLVQNKKGLGSAVLVMTDIWPNDLEVKEAYFLGSWCFNSRFDEYQARISGRIFDYHWNDRQKLRSDFEYLQVFNEQLLAELAEKLNQIHEINESLKFWRLLLGYWINLYTTVLLDRWSSLNQAKKYAIDWSAVAIQTNEELLATNDTFDFEFNATESSLWNQHLFMLIIKNNPVAKLKYVDVESSELIGKPNFKSISFKPKKLIRHIAQVIGNQLKWRDRFYLTGTRLPYIFQMGLEWALGQIPFLRFCPVSDVRTKYNGSFRRWSLQCKTVNDEFASAARLILPKVLPRAFLEGFQDLLIQSESRSFPLSPDVIFTSSDHFCNDLFNAWAAKKVSNGTRLIIGEHGGFGTGLFSGCHSYELSIADVYLSTGWATKMFKNITPIGFFRGRSENYRSMKNGPALLVCGNIPRYSFDIRPMALSSQILDYFEDQFCFIDSLPQRIKSEVRVRLYPVDYGWEQRERWLDRHPCIAFDDAKLSMMKTIRKCRLFIGTYNATTYIEPLFQNFPTVIFWNPMLWEIKKDAELIFIALKNAGIFHDTPQSAAKHVASIWDDISSWWKSEAVQNARKLFCDNYCSMPTDLIGSIKHVLVSESKRSSINISR